MRNPLPPHGAGDQDRNFRPLTTAVDKRGVSSRSQGACALRREGWACKLASASCPITVLRRARQQLPGLPPPCPGHAHAQTAQTSGTCGAPGRRPGSMYECQGAGWGEDAGIPCPRRRASSWKVELAPGGMPRARGVGICWHSSLRRTWVPLLPITPGFPSHTAGVGLLLAHAH